MEQKIDKEEAQKKALELWLDVNTIGTIIVMPLAIITALCARFLGGESWLMALIGPVWIGALIVGHRLVGLYTYHRRELPTLPRE